MKKRHGVVITFTGPSGGGKRTITTRVGKKVEMQMCVSMTSRKRGADEIPGVDYVYVTKLGFMFRILLRGFVEWTRYPGNGNFYGTPRSAILNVRQGAILGIELELSGYRVLRPILQRDYAEKVVSFFIMPPSMEILEQRLRNRPGRPLKGDEIAKRLARAEIEMASTGEFDYVIWNDDADRASMEIVQILEAFRSPALA